MVSLKMRNNCLKRFIVVVVLFVFFPCFYCIASKCKMLFLHIFVLVFHFVVVITYFNYSQFIFVFIAVTAFNHSCALKLRNA